VNNSGIKKATTIQINQKTFPILFTCLYKCAKILSDFKVELESKLSAKLSITPDHSEFGISFRPKDKDLITELVCSYENKRLEFKQIKIKPTFKVAIYKE